MGAMCNGSGCGGPTEEALKEMNKKGIYTPKQIASTVGNEWTTVNADGSKKVDKKSLEKICKQAVTTLGKQGGGDKFQAKKFNALINDQYADKEDFDLKQSVKIVTTMLTKGPDGKENKK